MSRTERDNRLRTALFFFGLFFFLSFAPDLKAFTTGPLTQDQTLYLEELRDEADQKVLHEKRYWRLLLRYRNHFFGLLRSEADGQGFFLSAKGRTHPRLELHAALGAFLAPEVEDPEQQHPQCRFPERYRWLKEQLNFDSNRLPDHPCPRFEEWKKVIDPESLTLIFSSYYVNNPATMFGHTLLRFDRAGDRKGLDLLDYAVNYAANTGDNPGPLYPIFGLLGGYAGMFSTYPYHYKVQQYVNVDRRDIWEYKLSLTQEQVNRAVNHLWELGATFFRYYFVDENCSYHLLGLLEVANPELDLRSDLHVFVAPSDTVKAIWREEGLVESIAYRPSKLSRFEQRLELLSGEERGMLSRLASENEAVEEVLPKGMEADRKALLVDTSIEYLSIRHKRPNVTDYQRELLRARSQIQAKVKVENKPRSTPPHLGHDSGRFGFGGGYGSDRSFGELRYRSAFHDLMAREIGYPENAGVEAGDIALRINEEGRRVHLEKFTGIGILSLYPISRFFKKMSWNVSFGWETLRTNDCGRCGSFFLRGGPGVSFQTNIGKREVLYLLANANVQLSPWSETDYRLGPLGRGGLLVDLASWWKLGIEGTYDYSPFGAPEVNYGGKVEQRFSLSKNSEIRILARKFKRGHEAGLAFQFYY